MARIVFRQQSRDVDVQREQVTHGVLVFGPIEPAEGIGSTGVGTSRCRTVERGFQIRHDRLVRRLIRPRAAGRRHHAAAKLPHDFLPGLRIHADVLHIERVEREPRCLDVVVVTADAVPIKAGPLRGDGGRQRARGRLLEPTDGTARYGYHRQQGKYKVQRTKYKV